MSVVPVVERHRLTDPALHPIADKVERGERLTRDDGLTLFRTPDLLGLGTLADARNRAMHGDRVMFAANQHLNPTNICILRKTCVFCSYARLPKEDGAYRYTLDQVLAESDEANTMLTREFHIVGGLDMQAGLAVLRRDVPGAQGAASARPHQGTHGRGDRPHRADREAVGAGRTGGASRSGAGHDARWGSRGLQSGRPRHDRGQEARR